MRFWRLGPSVWLATGGGVGFSPVMPGTLGALLGLPLSVGISQLGPFWLQVLSTAALCLVGIPICAAAARRLDGGKDPGAIVLDETAALPLVYWALPADQIGSPVALASGFALFRLFDVLKPPPIRQLERLPGGLGIMADDWGAAIYAGASLHLLWRLGVVQGFGQ